MVLSALFLAIAFALVLSGLAMSKDGGDFHTTAPGAFVALIGLLFFVGGLVLAALYALASTP